MARPASSDVNYHGLSQSQLADVVGKNQSREDGLVIGNLNRIPISLEDKRYLLSAADASEFYAADNYGDNQNIYRDVLRDKYLYVEGGEKGPLDVWYRQAEAIASVEDSPEAREYWTMEFMNALDDFKFVPGGRIMHGAGRDDITTTLNNCYVVAIKSDDFDAIYDAERDEGRTYKFGGGCGHDLSVLRPSDSPILGTGGGSCGPTGFMEKYSVNTNTVAQHGRRGANMQTMRVDHPDIEKFIKIKTGDNNRIKYSNISVLLTDPFMKALQNGGKFDLRFPDTVAYNEIEDVKTFYDANWHGNYEEWEETFKAAQDRGEIPSDLKPFKVHARVDANELFDMMIKHAHSSAEPGLIFWDTMRKYHNLEYVSPLVSTNPCGEQPLPDGGCCNLGAVNLEKMVTSDGEFDFELFGETLATGTRYLDNVIDYNLGKHALEEQRLNAINDRRVGIGILGMANAFVRMGIRYDSAEAIEKMEEIMEFMRDTVYKTSIQLAQEKEPAPNFKWEGYSQSKYVQSLPEEIRNQIKQHGIRNGTLLTVAPTGSGAIVSRVSSGIEPIFATEYNRKVKDQDSSEERFTDYAVREPILRELFGYSDRLPDYVVTAHDIDPFFRVKIQGEIQNKIDASISSTINLPSEVDVGTVAQIYREGYKQGLKGVTVYREQSRGEGILSTGRGGLEDLVEIELIQNDVKLDPRLERKAQAAKYKIKRSQNKDSLHVIVTSDLYVDDKNKKAYFILDEIFQERVKLGSADTVSFNQSGIDRTEIFRGPDPDYAEILERWQSPASDEMEGLGPMKIKSKEHAVSLAYEDILLRNGIVGHDDVGNAENIVRKRNLRKVEYGSEEYKQIMSQYKGSSNGENELEIKGNNGKRERFECGYCGGTVPRYESGCNTPRCSSCMKYPKGLSGCG